MFQAYKQQEDHGYKLSLGTYVSGEGTFNTGDPMIFEGGDNLNCPKNRTSEAYWYCWYNAYTEIVALDHM